MSPADEISPASAHETLTHPETGSRLPETASQLETTLPDSEPETSPLPQLKPSSQLFNISPQYELAPEDLGQQRAIDARTQLHMFTFDNDKNSARNLPGISNSQISIAPVAPGLESEETLALSRAEIGGLDGTPGLRHDSDASSPSTYVSKEEPATKYFYVNEEKLVTQDLERVTEAPPQNYIFRLRSKNFYILLFAAAVAIATIIVGAIFGTQKSKQDQEGHVVLDPMEKQSSTNVYAYPTPTFTAYPLETGPWEIKEPIDVEEGICAPNPQAIDRCDNPYEYKFNIFKDSVGFKIQTDLGVLNNKYLYPPKTPDGMYSFNVTDWEMASSGELAPTTCKTTVDAYFMLAENYRFHLIFNYKIKRRCELWNGYVAEPGQFCHCEWMGYVYDDFKGSGQTTTLKETPSSKLTKSLTTKSSIKSSTIVTIVVRPTSTTITDSTVVETLTSTVSQKSIVDATNTPGITIIEVQPPVEALTSTIGKTSILDTASTPEVTVVEVHSPVNTGASTVIPSLVATATPQ